MNFLEIIKNSINNLCAKYIERNLSDEMLPIFYVAAVSYTHLTLPTT